MQYLIYTYIIIFNAFAIVLREFLALKDNYKWLAAIWIRLFLGVTILISLFNPSFLLIMTCKFTTVSLLISGVVGILEHGIFYYFYRYKFPNILLHALIVFSACILIEAFCYNAIFVKLFEIIEINAFLVMGLITILLFGSAILFHLRVAKKMEVDNV